MSTSFFQWQDILQVIIPRSSALASAAASGKLCTQEEGYTTCPICLSPPTAPRMTKCGHVSVAWCQCNLKNTYNNNIGFLFPMHSSLFKYIGEQVGSLPYLFRFCERTTVEECQVV